MKWLETIKVQAASGQMSTVENELAKLTKDVQKSTDCYGLLDVALYNHASVPGCFAVHLSWDTESPQIRGSLFGLSLYQAMKTFGMVDHSVWIGKE